MPLVIYGLGGVHTHTHTRTRILSRTKVIIRNQARRPAAGTPGLIKNAITDGPNTLALQLTNVFSR